MNRKIIILFIFATMIFFAGMQEAMSRQSYMENFKQKYPGTIDTKIGTCILCHFENPQNNTFSWNPYGEDYRKYGNFTLIESNDSDNDGYSNIEEINNLTFPGNASDRPGIMASVFTTAKPTVAQPTVVQTTAVQQTNASPAVTKGEKAPGFEMLLAVFALLLIYHRKKN